jgi:arylesterase/paraoxonase
VLGTVMLLDLSLPEPRPRPALTMDPPNFRPHGMSLYRTGDGSERLFVISHPPGAAHAIEVFEQGPTGAFMPVRTLHDALLVRPNAILAVGPNQFYVANDSGATGGFSRATEMLFRRGLSTLLFFDGEKFRVVDSGIASAAGLAMSLDGATIYVSETSANRLRRYSRKPSSGDVQLIDTIDVGSAPDNINLAGDGSLWIAAHANTLALIRHFGDAKRLAPTQVFRLTEDAAGKPTLKEIYLNAGEQLSAGSVAAAFGGEMLLGSITDHKILRCRIP